MITLCSFIHNFSTPNYILRYFCLQPSPYWFTVNMLTFGIGTIAGWPSASLLILGSATDTPLPSGPLTIHEMALVGSIYAIGGLIGNFLYGLFTNRYGCKYPLMATAIPQVVGDNNKLKLFITYLKNELSNSRIGWLDINNICCKSVLVVCGQTFRRHIRWWSLCYCTCICCRYC